MDGELTVTLFVRSLSPSGLRERQEDVLGRLDALEENDTIETYSVEVWGKQLALKDAHRSDPGERISDHLESLREWAATHGYSLKPFFETKTIDSKFTGGPYTRTEFPVMTLVEYMGDEIQFVSPCADGDSITTVSDRLNELETNGADSYVPDLQIDQRQLQENQA